MPHDEVMSDDLGPATSSPATSVASLPSQELLVMTWPGQEELVRCFRTCQYGAAGQPLTSCTLPDPEARAASSSTATAVVSISAVNVAVTGAAVVWTAVPAPPGLTFTGAVACAGEPVAALVPGRDAPGCKATTVATAATAAMQPVAARPARRLARCRRRWPWCACRTSPAWGDASTRSISARRRSWNSSLTLLSLQLACASLALSAIWVTGRALAHRGQAAG